MVGLNPLQNISGDIEHSSIIKMLQNISPHMYVQGWGAGLLLSIQGSSLLESNHEGDVLYRCRSWWTQGKTRVFEGSTHMKAFNGVAVGILCKHIIFRSPGNTNTLQRSEMFRWVSPFGKIFLGTIKLKPRINMLPIFHKYSCKPFILII